MNLMPEEELTQRASLNLAPMVDFLFLILAVFAVLSITTSKVFMQEIDLAKTENADSEATPVAMEYEPLSLFVTKDGEYLFEQNDALIKYHKCQAITHEIQEEQRQGELPVDSSMVNILLHIDKEAHWESVMQLLLSLQTAGYNVQTVYQQEAGF